MSAVVKVARFGDIPPEQQELARRLRRAITDASDAGMDMRMVIEAVVNELVVATLRAEEAGLEDAVEVVKRAAVEALDVGKAAMVHRRPNDVGC